MLFKSGKLARSWSNHGHRNPYHKGHMGLDDMGNLRFRIPDAYRAGTVYFLVRQNLQTMTFS